MQVDKHSETVPLEAAINAALVAVPHYVLDTLLGMPSAVPRAAAGLCVPSPSPSRHTQPSFDLVSALSGRGGRVWWRSAGTEKPVRHASPVTDGDTVLATARLRLVPATSTMITAELEHPDDLVEVLGAELAVDWPPEHHDRDTLRFWREELKRPGAAGWWLHYALYVRRGVRSTLVGSVGYKGPPEDGVVEIGYSVVPSWQRQGLATEACHALIESAWRRGAAEVVAHTLDGLEPSIGVLRKFGFVASGASEPGVLAFTLRRRGAHQGVR